MEIINNVLSKISQFYTEHPAYAYLSVALILAVVAIGNFLGWQWAISPSGSKQRFYYNLVGPKIFGYFMGTVFLIGAVAMGILAFCSF